MGNNYVYPNADEKLVRAIILYAGTEGGLFYDEEKSNEVTKDEALDLFKKGLILVSADGGFKRPVGITVSGSTYTLVYGDETEAPEAELPEFDPVADEGKVLKIVSGELAWAADNTGAAG